jgi:hypothetical protein
MIRAGRVGSLGHLRLWQCTDQQQVWSSKVEERPGLPRDKAAGLKGFRLA